MIDKSTVQKIKDAANIVEVVSDYVHLTRRGANYMGLCPFHNERTPSFSVNSRRNFCYCFSCHKGGSPVNFIMEKEGISYHDALLHLAKKYGIKVEERELTDEERKLATEREGMMVASEWAMKQMERDLIETEEGRSIGLTYLYHRGVTEDAIKKFHLGYAIDRGDHLTSIMQKAGFETDVLQSLGLTGKSQSGRYYDKYRGRVIFPIMNPSGKVVGFGGRDLKGGPAKYINSPESSLYRKNSELYGIFQAKNEIVRQDKCYLVEGYLDVIGMWMSGMENTVASSGTALTDGQIALIHRFTKNITLVYDGDKAGIKAALRGIDMLLLHKMQVKVLLLPDGDDPDSFAKKHSPEEFRDYVKSHERDIIQFKMQVMLNEMGDSPQEKAAVINSVVESIACIANDVERTVYVGECSRMLGIDESKISSAVERARFRIISQQQLERRRRQSGVDFPIAEQDNKELDEASSPSEELNIAAAIEHKEKKINFPMAPLEHKMILYCVRYGYQPFEYSESSDDDTEETGESEGDVSEQLYTIVDYINDELTADSIQFSVPEFRGVFEELLNHLDEYIEHLDDFRSNLEERITEEREKGRNEIAVRVGEMTIQKIESEERRLEQRLDDMRRKEINDFSRDYPGNFLASHENESLRRVANEMLREKHILSNLFGGLSAMNGDLSISQQVMRGLTEWRSEILENHIAEVIKEIAQYEDSDSEQLRDAMLRYSRLQGLRARLAKNNGERIVSPRRN